MIRIDDYYYVFKKYDSRHNEIKEEDYDKDSVYDVFNSSWEKYSDQYVYDGTDSRFINTSHEYWYKIFEFFGYIDNEENYKYWVYNYIDGHPIMNSYRIYRKFKSDEGRELYFTNKERKRIYEEHEKRKYEIWHIKSKTKREIQMEIENKRFDEEYGKMFEESEDESDDYHYVSDKFEIFIESVDNQVHKVNYIRIYKGKVAQVLVIHSYNGNNIEFHKTETGIYVNTYVYQGIHKRGIEEWKLITAFEPLEPDEVEN